MRACADSTYRARRTLQMNTRNNELATNTQDCATATKMKPARIEAYGVKGMKSRPWRRTFKDAAALLAWCEENDAQVYAQRDADGR